jgi:para-nitrobenzyl esterase
MVFKGIRYGENTSSSRFQPAAAVKSFSGDVDAASFGAASPQTHPAEPTSEDCLFLNIWAPQSLTKHDSLPVLVYLHGGEYSHGSGSSPLTDGSILAREQRCVVVTLNHRLSILGHLSLSLFGSERFRYSANIGLLDVILALHWIRDNIGYFGGNPDCVTLFGQSGGGAKIASLMAMPRAEGLFHRALTMSGQQVTASGPLAAKRRAQTVLDFLKIRPHNVDEILNVDLERLIEACELADPTLDNSKIYFGPVLDRVSLPQHPFFPQISRQCAKIPMIIGGTLDEVRVFFSAEQKVIDAYSFEDVAARLAREMRIDCDPSDVVQFYRRLMPDALPAELFYRAVTDSRSWRGGVIEAEARASAGAPAYVYQVNFAPKHSALRACHMVDIPLWFGTTAVPDALCGNSEDAQRISARLRNMLRQFALTGDPNCSRDFNWVPYSLDNRETLTIDNTFKVENDPRRDARQYFERFPFIQRGTT